jgi:hypothetical protein
MTKFLHLKKETFTEYGAISHKELWDKVKGEYKGFVFDAETTYTKAEGSDNKYHFIFSTDTEDRHGQRVFQNFDLKSFKKNPVFLDSHNYYSIEKILGKIDRAKVKDNKFQGDVIFNLKNPLGLMARDMAEDGFLFATSIGTIPNEFDSNGNILKSEIIEVSAVSVPANPEALLERSVEVKSVDDIEPEATELPTELEIKKVDYVSQGNKKSLFQVISEMKEKDTHTLMKIASGLAIKNPHEKKRKLFSTIRDGLK